MCICSICRINNNKTNLRVVNFQLRWFLGVLALICGCRKDLPINPSKTHVTKKRRNVKLAWCQEQELLLFLWCRSSMARSSQRDGDDWCFGALWSSSPLKAACWGGDGQILDRMGKPVRVHKIRKNKTCKSGSKKSIYLRRKIVGFQIAMLVIAKPGFEEAGPFSSSAAGLTFVGLPAEWLNFQPFLEQSCSLIYLWWSRGTANTSGTVLPILACCQGFPGFICLSWHPQNGWRLRPKMRQKPSISMNMLIC